MRLFETKISPYYAKKDIAEVIESGNLGFGSNVIKFEMNLNHIVIESIT
jgi:hypothetical protein